MTGFNNNREIKNVIREHGGIEEKEDELVLRRNDGWYLRAKIRTKEIIQWNAPLVLYYVKFYIVDTC